MDGGPERVTVYPWGAESDCPKHDLAAAAAPTTMAVMYERLSLLVTKPHGRRQSKGIMTGFSSESYNIQVVIFLSS